MTMNGAREKIAILGGGVGSMVAAWELTSVPGWQDRYELDVYQLGWRLGGKGASGRNRKEHDRIEEHGLHVWMGFYENAFKVMREAYAELGRAPGQPLAGVWDAFKPHSYVVWEDKGSGTWSPWPIRFPRNSALPGAGGMMPSPWNYIEMMVGWIVECFEHEDVGAHPAQIHARLGPLLRERKEGLDAVVQTASQGGLLDATSPVTTVAWLGRALADAGLSVDALGLHLASDLIDACGADPTTHTPQDHDAIVALLSRFRTWLAGKLGPGLPDGLRRFLTLVDLTIGNVLGFLASGLLFWGEAWEKIDELDYRQWLTPFCLDKNTPQCAPVQAFYDLVFSEDCGIAAGATLVCAMRMLFTYKGAIFFKMQAGMGDTVFGPLYEALRKRGVRFHFFNKVDQIIAADGAVSRIDLTVQATVKGGGEYAPLFDVKGLPCWPSTPLYEQLEQGDALEKGGYNLESAWTDWPGVAKKSLAVGRDFDRVVLGISIGSFPFLAQSLLDQSPAMKTMVAGVTTTKTQACQLWMNKDLHGLGWPLHSPVLTSYVAPFDTWADMSQLIVREGWSPVDGPANIAYLCCAMAEGAPSPPPGPDPRYPDGQTAIAKQLSVEWLKKDASVLWPNTAAPPDGFDWSVLCAPDGTTGEARFDSQYWRANVDPSERYVRTVPGSTKVRLRSHQSGFSNLVLAGDWVKNALNGGCVESAAMGGMQASRAICGYPKVIVGDPTVDPPPPPPPSGLPPYIDRGGNLILRQPFLQTNTRLYAFVLPSRYESLVTLVDQCLNAPLGERRYMPVAGFTTLVCANIPMMHSTNPIDSQKGHMSELDIGLWVPVASGREVDGTFVPEKLFWFLPYIYVDNAPAMATGREIYGFPKQAGTLAIPIDENEPGRILADVIVLPTYSPETKAEMRRVIEVASTSPPCELRADFDTAAALAKGLRGRLVESFFHEKNSPPFSWKLLESIVTELFTGEMPMVFLQQFRDVEFCNGSAYQAIVEAPTKVAGFHGAGFLHGDHEVSIHSFASHPMATDLGLPDGPIRPVMQMWVDFDFTIDAGNVVWNGGREPTRGGRLTNVVRGARAPSGRADRPVPRSEHDRSGRYGRRLSGRARGLWCSGRAEDGAGRGRVSLARHPSRDPRAPPRAASRCRAHRRRRRPRGGSLVRDGAARRPHAARSCARLVAGGRAGRAGLARSSHRGGHWLSRGGRNDGTRRSERRAPDAPERGRPRAHRQTHGGERPPRGRAHARSRAVLGARVHSR